jgi:hypothetical protein
MAKARDTGERYETTLDPRPAAPGVAHLFGEDQLVGGAR